jgi:hypothetical protein
VDFLTVLPLAFVMIAGPQIISAFFFATSASWRPLSAAYVIGAIASVTLISTAAFLLINGTAGSSSGETGLSTVDYLVLALLVFAMVHQFRGRHQTEPPKWMGRLEGATPKLAFVLGFLLLGVFPSDLVTSISVGSHLADRGDSWWQLVPFISLMALLLALPALLVLVLGDRAEAVLPRVRDWMDTNSWIVSEAVLVLFIVIILSGG